MQHTIKDSQDVFNHIVVCGIHSSIVHFILPLRSRSLGFDNLKYIVFLSPILPPKIYEWLIMFPRIIFIQGSPLLPENLYRANIMNADKAAILSKNSDFDNMQDLMKDFNEVNNSDENMINLNGKRKMSDAEAIFIYKAIKKCNKNIQIVTDLISTENIEYLLHKKYISTISFRKDFLPLYEYTPLFASGEVFFPGIIDRITCQSYFNPHILAILKKLLIGGTNQSKKVQKLEEDLNIQDSMLWLIKVPDFLVNDDFETLFNHFIKGSNVISLGLYRKNIYDDFYYVYTNPVKSTLIQKEDMVYVLGLNTNILDLMEEKHGNQDEKETDTKSDILEETDNIENNSDSSLDYLMKNKDESENKINLKMKNLKKKNSKNFGTFEEYENKENQKKEKLKNSKSISIKSPKNEKIKKPLLRALSFEKLSTKHIEIENLSKRIDIINENIYKLKREYENFPNLINKIIDQEINKEFQTIICENFE